MDALRVKHLHKPHYMHKTHAMCRVQRVIHRVRRRITTLSNVKFITTREWIFFKFHFVIDFFQRVSCI